MNEDTKFTDLSELLHDHESAVAKLFEMLTSFHEAREATYKRSFAKRGEIGVWMNLARKYDRFEALAPQVLLGEGSGVTLIDTLVDTLMYSAKWLDVISKIRPDDFQEWIRTVYCKDTGLSYEEVVELYPFLNVLEDSATTLYRMSMEFNVPKREDLSNAAASFFPVRYQLSDGAWLHGWKSEKLGYYAENWTPIADPVVWQEYDWRTQEQV